MKLKINHFNINVTNIEKSVKWYEENLHLHILRTKDAPDGSYKLVYMADENNFISIELTWLRDKVGSYNLGDNEFHIALTTDDYQATYKMHQERNLIVYDNQKMGVYFIADPDGYWIEILPEKR